MEAVLNWVATYGYCAVFILLVLGIVGLPVPDEWLLVFSGYLIWVGRLNPAATFAAALAGSCCGITCSYWIGRKFGPLAPIPHRHLERVHKWFEKIGHWALAVGYFIPGVRHFTAVVAGASELEFGAFAGYAYSGALLWVCTFLFIGYHFGERWKIALVTVEHHTRLALAGIAALGVCYLLFRYVTRNSRSSPPAPPPS